MENIEQNTEFIPFPKMARYSRECIVTEKIDGTSACIFIGEDGEFLTGSRTRWITPGDDNHGFSRWAHDHQNELMELGPGRHFGEWWGSGIQRGYGLTNGEKRFSLFNATRWAPAGAELRRIPMADPRIVKFQEHAPACCHIVPELDRGPFDEIDASMLLLSLANSGSVAAPGFMKPEGIVIFHCAANTGFKKTLERDDQPKGKN